MKTTNFTGRTVDIQRDGAHRTLTVTHQNDKHAFFNGEETSIGYTFDAYCSVCGDELQLDTLVPVATNVIVRRNGDNTRRIYLCLIIGSVDDRGNVVSPQAGLHSRGQVTISDFVLLENIVGVDNDNPASRAQHSAAFVAISARMESLPTKQQLIAERRATAQAKRQKVEAELREKHEHDTAVAKLKHKKPAAKKVIEAIASVSDDYELSSGVAEDLCLSDDINTLIPVAQRTPTQILRKLSQSTVRRAYSLVHPEKKGLTNSVLEMRKFLITYFDAVSHGTSIEAYNHADISYSDYENSQSFSTSHCSASQMHSFSAAQALSSNEVPIYSRPSHSSAPPPPPPPSGPPPQKEVWSKFNDQYGTPYWINSDTKESTWFCPHTSPPVRSESRLKSSELGHLQPRNENQEPRSFSSCIEPTPPRASEGHGIRPSLQIQDSVERGRVERLPRADDCVWQERFEGRALSGRQGSLEGHEQQDCSERQERFEPHERPYRQYRLELQERNERLERQDRFERHERFERYERLERHERFERHERLEPYERGSGLDRIERQERIERFERNERLERHERFERNERYEQYERLQQQERFERQMRFFGK